MYIVKGSLYNLRMEENEEPLSVIFSQNFRRLRKKKGLTQYDLADATGFSQRMIAHYETHAVQLSLDKLEKIAKVLRVKPAELLTKESPSEEAPDPTAFDTRSLKRMQDILSLPPNERSELYRMLNRMLRENRNQRSST